METTQDLAHVVIDLGSDTIKCGYNNENVPQFEIPNVIGRYKKNSISIINNVNKCFCGEEAIYNSPSLTLKYPKSDNDGKFDINSTEGLKDIESLFEYIFEKKFHINQESYNVFIIDSLFSPIKERGAIANILYEKFRLYNLHFEPQEIMALFSTSKTTGIIVNSGEMETTIVPAYEGYIIPPGIATCPLGGKTLTDKFLKFYKNIFDLNNVNNQKFMAKNIKEEFGELLPDRQSFENLIKNNKSDKKVFYLPDGNSINIGNERFEIPEIMFNPQMINIDSKNLPQLIYDSIQKCDISTRKGLFDNIIVVGGNTLINGFSNRFKNELENVININDKGAKRRNYKIYETKERKYGAWIGASGICSLSDFFDKWVNRNIYFDFGEKIFEQNYLFNYDALVKK